MINTKDLPHSPGCYLFKDKNNKIIYIGKAKDIKKRVSSYFTKKDHDDKTKNLVKNINSLKFIATNNELEAYVLENNLIKKNTPKYNIDLKDSKGYAYLQITKETFPRLILTRKKDSKGKLYGPFLRAQNRDYLLSILRKTFQLRTCKKMPKRPCLRYHINLCPAPCAQKISKNEYNLSIKSAEEVLNGKSGDLVKNLRTRMKRASKNLDFEKSLVYREQIASVLTLQEKQRVEKNKKYDEDIINYLLKNGQVYLALFNISKGILLNKQEFVFDYSESFIEEFIARYYSNENIPARLIVPHHLDESLVLFLKRLRKKNVSVIVPIKGDKKNLLELVKKNIELANFSDTKSLIELKNVLNLQEIPLRIECFDISHLSGTNTVASMVSFRAAEPDKSNYRRYKIRTVYGIDDVASIREVVKRRYTRVIAENIVMPDLIIIDGGIGQLNAAIIELNKLNLKIPIISIAKRFEEIYVPGLHRPLKLDKKNKALLLLQRVRNEAHRFAISYNRLLRKKKAFNSEKSKII